MKVDAILDGLKTMKDGGLKLTFSTNELSPEAASYLLSMANQFCTIEVTEGDQLLMDVENVEVA